jgi:formylglycine-generating enzyme required for sulfatase activity
VRPEAERLLDELERPEATHFRRAEIGDRLDRIDDPRPGIGLRPDGGPDIVWCGVPGGTVTLEGVEGSFAVEPFAIAKYPFTYRQYRAFLDDPQGYRDERWWKDLQHEETPGEQVRPTGNCPAENVSWYDAMAYCRWLSERLGAEIRLPTEWEWQQAATGGQPDYEYPWGTEWIGAYVNTYENRLSRTTAVGVYPRGASAHGVLDLAGNVWEWCLNKYESPRDCDPAGEGPRVVRGGSWHFLRDYARCAYRLNFVPGSRDRFVGSRVVRVSPIS